MILTPELEEITNSRVAVATNTKIYFSEKIPQQDNQNR
jgi:hypothetical protein